LTLFYFLFASECESLSDDFNKYKFEDSNDWDKLGSFLALVEFEGQQFSYLDNLMGLNSPNQGFSFPTSSFISFRRLIPL